MVEKGKAVVDKMDLILRDPYLDTRIKKCILLDVIVPQLEYAGEVWGGEREIGGEVGNSADGRGKKDTRMFENGEHHSIEGRVGNVLS